MKFRKFTKLPFLKGIGRPHLLRLFDRFKAELEAAKIALPDSSLEDDGFYAAVAAVAMNHEGLPAAVLESLFTIEEMANEVGQERLEQAMSRTGLELNLAEDSSHGDIAVQVWLEKPELLVEKHNELRLCRLTGFEYHGTAAPEDRSTTFLPPTPASLTLLEADLDAWCKQHNRGDQTAQIEIYPIDGEVWFLVRHGDTFARKAKVDRRHREVLHFRPDKDDVVVYSPSRDEIRVHASTKGEREFYRKAFGLRLFGDDNYFSEKRAYTLDPLLNDGVDVLDVTGIEHIERIVLIETEIHLGGRFDEVEIRKADDVFEATKARGANPFPAGARPIRAGFEVYFKGTTKPRKVQLRPPNVLKLGRYCDEAAVQRWLSERGFRANAK